jgi:ABC-type transport system involved in multi-copper enzyme maturation permease subunit
MTRRIWDDLVVKNPMLIEIQRFRRRFLSFSGSNTLNSAVLVLALVCYAGMVLLVLEARDGLSPQLLIVFQTGLFTVFAPGMLHGAIAGERERRSWDLLLVAPISKAQIVAGKFIGALAALGVAAGLLLFPILIAAISYRHTNWFDLLTSEAVSLSFVIAVCALTILLSARVRRPFMALGASLGSLGILLIVVPLLLGVFQLKSTSLAMEELFLYHPFYVLFRLYNIDEGMYSGDAYLHAGMWGWPQVFLYLALAAILVGWAANTLNFAENEVKFLPRGHTDA